MKIVWLGTKGKYGGYNSFSFNPTADPWEQVSQPFQRWVDWNLHTYYKLLYAEAKSSDDVACVPESVLSVFIKWRHQVPLVVGALTGLFW